MKEAVIGFIIALVVSCAMAGMENNPISPTGWTFSQAAVGDTVPEVNVGTFQGEVLDSSLPVLVEFYKQNDPHCITMKPIINKLATDSQGYVRVVKIDVDSNQVLTERYDVEGVPGYVLFKEGKAINGLKGELTQPELTKWVKRELDMPVD
jgi:thioredoxin-like negative regulator of GroEL